MAILLSLLNAIFWGVVLAIIYHLLGVSILWSLPWAGFVFVISLFCFALCMVVPDEAEESPQ